LGLPVGRRMPWPEIAAKFSLAGSLSNLYEI
jgi:hypothetical protein